ncbi:hypothetical protein ACH5RR_034966 [Cinchona calisaya]|uniref:Cyclin D3 n=1 Tax=Cinchona calisaya TaxID=153742 RepID=A0ABD2YG08_9GENT
MAHQHQNEPKFPFLLDALYCEDESFITREESQCVNNNIDSKPLFSFEQDFLWEDEELCSLFTKEQENSNLYNGLERWPCLTAARNEAVEWILKVTTFYSFSAATAVVAVNYLDRFLFRFQSHSEKNKPSPMTQLAAVACLFLAAKVEETRVPLLLDFQVEESKYVFEAKTIKRMEILVLSTLEWKMNPVTPLSFIDHFITRRLRGLKKKISWELLRRCHCLLLFIISDCRFMCFLPSVMATATMLHVITSLEPCLGLEFQDQLLGILGVNKLQDKVQECYRLISEVAATFDFHSSNKRKFRSLPCSIKGVMDMSFSCGSSSNSWSVAAASASSSPQPLSKKSRPHNEDQQHANVLDHAT